MHDARTLVWLNILFDSSSPHTHIRVFPRHCRPHFHGIIIWKSRRNLMRTPRMNFNADSCSFEHECQFINIYFQPNGKYLSELIVSRFYFESLPTTTTTTRRSAQSAHWRRTVCWPTASAGCRDGAADRPTLRQTRNRIR